MISERIASITIDPVTEADSDDINRIVDEEGLPKAWVWPQGLPGTSARVDGRVVAFCIIRETIYGIVIEELWREHSRNGVRGIYALGDWIEETVQRLASERGVPVACGGIVRDELVNHQSALRKRGFRKIAEVLEKVYQP